VLFLAQANKYQTFAYSRLPWNRPNTPETPLFEAALSGGVFEAGSTRRRTFVSRAAPRLLGAAD
jgi:hypothetical protein